MANHERVVPAAVVVAMLTRRTSLAKPIESTLGVACGRNLAENGASFLVLQRGDERPTRELGRGTGNRTDKVHTGRSVELRDHSVFAHRADDNLRRLEHALTDFETDGSSVEQVALLGDLGSTLGQLRDLRAEGFQVLSRDLESFVRVHAPTIAMVERLSRIEGFRSKTWNLAGLFKFSFSF